MAIDPRSILAAVPKPGGRKAILLRRVAQAGDVRLEIGVAEVLPAGRGYRALRSIGIRADMLDAFGDAVTAALGSFRSAKP